MEGDSNQLAVQWIWEGVTLEALEETATWLSESRQLGSGAAHFFSMAGRLLMHARFDYFLIEPMFFQAVIGLERALRIHYKAPRETYTEMSEGNLDSFRNLFKRAVEENIIGDEIFGEIRPLPKELVSLCVEEPKTYSELLASLVPELRNRYFHGNWFLIGEFYPLTIQLRKCADVLKSQGSKSLVE
ncbi:MAG: hypothetical protein P1U85_06005 [Verrucomicrobiales bacterium]|nr:hypothetical protein [Verrucomicrobiales bacterium]